MIMKKIKEYIKIFFKENYKALIILLIIFVIANYKLDVSIYTPGGMIDLSERISSDDQIYESSGSLNMTYVTFLILPILLLILSIQDCLYLCHQGYDSLFFEFLQT